MAVIKKQSLVDQIYARLRELIITGKLPLGSRINVSELQQSLGVSSTPLREALNRLQQDGLVVLRPNLGASVLALEPHDIDEIQELALTLQAAAVRLALARADREQIACQLEDQLAHYAAARSPKDQVRAVFDLIGVFYRHCGNRRLDQSMVALQAQVLLLRHLYARQSDCRDHSGLLAPLPGAVRDNDPDRVIRLLEDYQQATRPRLDGD